MTWEEDYRGVFVFDNDHPCVGEHAPIELPAPPGIYENRPARGVARVICYTPRHDLSELLGVSTVHYKRAAVITPESGT